MWFYCIIDQSTVNYILIYGKIVLTKWFCIAHKIANFGLEIDHMGFHSSLSFAGSQYCTNSTAQLSKRSLINLFFQVLQWRAQQEEAAKLEAAIAARRKEKEDEKERLRKEQEIIHRSQEKEKVG